MRFVIVTGVSGAGKSTVLKMLEDAHYFCVDNLPIPLVEKFASLMLEVHEEGVRMRLLVLMPEAVTLWKNWHRFWII